MRTLEQCLRLVPQVYADLVDAALPARTGEPSDRSPDPREKPAPGNLTVMEHRHKLVRGLRWWADAVSERTGTMPVGHHPARMCALILHNLQHMAEEDRDELRRNLEDWLTGAYPFMGRPEPVTRATLPLEALDAIVPQSVAAKALGVHVTTVRRRAGRAGSVKLAEVAGPLCEHSDLPERWCAHCAATREYLRSTRALR